MSELAELRGVIARGWCADKNSHKEMDSDLAEAIAIEVQAHLESIKGRERAAVVEQARSVVLSVFSEYAHDGIKCGRIIDQLRSLSTRSFDELVQPLKDAAYREGQDAAVDVAIGEEILLRRIFDEEPFKSYDAALRAQVEAPLVSQINRLIEQQSGLRAQVERDVIHQVLELHAEYNRLLIEDFEAAKDFNLNDQISLLKSNPKGLWLERQRLLAKAEMAELCAESSESPNAERFRWWAESHRSQAAALESTLNSLDGGKK